MKVKVDLQILFLVHTQVTLVYSLHQSTKCTSDIHLDGMVQFLCVFTQVLVWHTRTEVPKMKHEDRLIQMRRPSNPRIEVWRGLELYLQKTKWPCWEFMYKCGAFLYHLHYHSTQELFLLVRCTTQALCPTFVLQLQRNKLLQSWELYQTWDGMSGMVSLAMRLGEVLLLHAIPTKYAWEPLKICNYVICCTLL